MERSGAMWGTGAMEREAWEEDTTPAMVPDLHFLIFFLKKKNGNFARLRDLATFIPFLVVFLLSVMLDAGTTSAHRLVESISHEISGVLPTGPNSTVGNFTSYTERTFEDIIREDEFWQWLLAGRGPSAIFRDGNIAGQNRVLGGMRVSQRRATLLPPDQVWKSDTPTLYGDYTGWMNISKDDPDIIPMRNDDLCGVDGVGRSPWRYTKVAVGRDRQLETIAKGPFYHGGIDNPVHGKLGTFEPHGYFRDFNTDMGKDEFAEVIRCMQGNHWITPETRMVEVLIYTYNAPMDLFAQVRYFIEITPAGTWLPQHRIVPFRMPIYEGTYAVLQTLLYAYVFGFLAKLLMEIVWNVQRTGRWFLWAFSVWRLLELQNLLVFLLSFSWSISLWRRDASVDLNKLNSDPTHYSAMMAQNEHELSTLQTQRNLQALNAMFSAIKLFRFFSGIPALSLLTEMVKSVILQLLQLAAYCFLITAAYSTAGLVLFGSQVMEYRTFGLAFKNLLLTLLGDFEFNLLRDADTDGAADLFFISYTILMWLVILNMVIAIIERGHDIATEMNYRQVGKMNLAYQLRAMWVDFEDRIAQLCGCLGGRKRRDRNFPIVCNRVLGITVSSVEHALRPMLCPEVWCELHEGEDFPTGSQLWCSRAAIQAQLVEELELDEELAKRLASLLCWFVSDGTGGFVDNRFAEEMYTAKVLYRNKQDLASGSGYKRRYLLNNPYPDHGAKEMSPRTADGVSASASRSEEMSDARPEAVVQFEDEQNIRQKLMDIEALAVKRAQLLDEIATTPVEKEGLLGAMERLSR